VSPWLERLTARVQLGSELRPPDDSRRRAAVAIIIHDAASPRVLLMKRVERAGDPWSGHISLPGGRHERADPDLLATAIRETREELGVELASARVLGNLPALSPLSSGPNCMEVTPFVFACRDAPEPRPSPEAEAAFWLPIELGASGALDDTYLYPGSERTFPSWRYERYVIWGLTWRILQDVLALAR
jgi:8-oxo-dGTP pyrophosphatase MutT (NUDIX family)